MREEDESAWFKDYEAAGRWPLAQRRRHAFVKTYEPAMDGARFGAFESMAEYRDWC